jgi:hypothetical protein
MTRKDYTIIAQAIADSINGNGKIYPEVLIDIMSKALKTDNSKFNTGTFKAYIQANK